MTTEQKIYKGETEMIEEDKDTYTRIINPIELGFKLGFGLFLFSLVASITLVMLMFFLGIVLM